MAATGAIAVLVGCSAPLPMVQPAGGSINPMAVPAGLEDLYQQQVEWSSCGSNFDCADVEVPMDYDDPAGETINIAVKRFNSTSDGEPLGTMFINPGGPGGSGIEMVESANIYFSGDLLAAYDIVGFDPRGVGESHGVRCYDDDELEELFSNRYDLDTDDGWVDYVEDNRAYGEACAERTGPLINFLDTVSAARDLDVLRGTIGEETLTYFGFSYGTQLGAAYAELFPDRVGRLVLDGGVDPSLSYAQINAGQNDGFELAYRSYLADCLAGAECPFTGDVDEAWDRTVSLLDELAANPAPDPKDPDRPVTDSDLFGAIIVAMYSSESWPTLTAALAQYLNNNDPSTIRYMADIASERADDGSYPEDKGAFGIITCLDYPVETDRSAIEAEADALEEANDLFGPRFGYGEVGCMTMPFEATGEPHPIAAVGAAPIVVIGTTRDPATPYEWSQALAEQLEEGVLLTYDGDGHTAYGASSCIDTPVDEFLIEGTVPTDGLQC